MQIIKKQNIINHQLKTEQSMIGILLVEFIGPWDWLSQFFWHLIAKMIYIRCEDIHLNMKYEL